MLLKNYKIYMSGLELVVSEHLYRKFYLILDMKNTLYFLWSSHTVYIHIYILFFSYKVKYLNKGNVSFHDAYDCPNFQESTLCPQYYVDI